MNVLLQYLMRKFQAAPAALSAIPNAITCAIPSAMTLALGVCFLTSGALYESISHSREETPEQDPTEIKPLNYEALSTRDEVAKTESGAAGAISSRLTGITLRTLKTHSRLSFQVDDGTQPIYRGSPQGFELNFKGLTLMDFGATVGQEQQWISEAKKRIRDSRLASLDFIESREGVKIKGKWKFPTGVKELAFPVMERFEYHLKTPPQYVMDIWEKAGPTKIAYVASERLRLRELDIKKSTERAGRQAERRLASVKAKEDAEDLEKFCKVPLSEKNDIFLNFQPVHSDLQLRRWFSTTTPDANYNYLDPKTDTPDAKYVRLALDLYKKGKSGLVIRTLDFFDEEHPKSVYRQEMRFLRANALIKLGHNDAGMKLLEEILDYSQKSPVALYVGMFLASKNVEKGQHLAALEGFLWLVNRYPVHSLNWVFHLGAAEALYHLRQTERAAKEYQWVAANAPMREAQAEAALRAGDIFLLRMQYEQAVSSYFQGLNLFPEESKKFPTAYINRAESLYGLKEYDRAEKAFSAFLSKFPGNPAAWRATFRLGEIFARKVGIENQKKSRQWYLDTVNLSPFSPGAVLARMRMITCDDHGGFTLASGENFFEVDAKKFTGNGEVAMERYAALRALSHVRMLTSFHEEEKAVEAAFEELKTGSYSSNKTILVELLQKLFRKSILSLLESGKNYEALSFYREHIEQIPKGNKNSNKVDPDYLLKLSQSASSLGLGGFATQLVQKYEENKKMFADPSRAIASQLANADDATGTDGFDIDEELKKSETAFTSAKADWIQKSVGNLKEIDDELRSNLIEKIGKISETSPYSYDREIMLGIIEQKQGKTATALKHALQAQVLIPQNLKSENEEVRRLLQWVALLQGMAGNKNSAIEIYRGIRKEIQHEQANASENASKKDGIEKEEMQNSKKSISLPTIVYGVLPMKSVVELALAEGELLGQQNRWGEAALTYEFASEAGKASSQGNQALYEYSRTLAKTKRAADFTKSNEVLKNLAQSKVDDFWRKLARKALGDDKNAGSQGGLK